jgi:hypothetical protein
MPGREARIAVQATVGTALRRIECSGCSEIYQILSRGVPSRSAVTRYAGLARFLPRQICRITFLLPKVYGC